MIGKGCVAYRRYDATLAWRNQNRAAPIGHECNLLASLPFSLFPICIFLSRHRHHHHRLVGAATNSTSLLVSMCFLFLSYRVYYDWLLLTRRGIRYRLIGRV